MGRRSRRSAASSTSPSRAPRSICISATRSTSTTAAPAWCWASPRASSPTCPTGCSPASRWSTRSASARRQPPRAQLPRGTCVAGRVQVAAPLVLALVLALGPVGPARAQDDEGYQEEDDPGGQYAADTAPDPSSYGEALAPYGTWIDDDQNGQVWQPAVSVDWAPYTDGYWAWTPYGWTWVSSEPWAWTFHYGRWGLLPGGWAWVPGTVWGPGGARRTPTRLGNPWRPGLSARASAPAFQVRRPALQAPPRLGGVRRDPPAVWNPPRAPFGAGGRPPLGRPGGPVVGTARPAPP